MPGLSLSASPPRVVGPGAAGAARNCIVTDYDGGLDLARSMPPHRAAILVLTDLDKEQQVEAALRRGVDAYLLHGCGLQELREAIDHVRAGRPYLAQALRARCEGFAAARRLTPRESDILALLARGHCNKSIARALDISAGTVKSHLKVVFRKLGAKGRMHAVVLATERGLTV
jgi:DNA-binding NarL/FixJ family response regulator